MINELNSNESVFSVCYKDYSEEDYVSQLPLIKSDNISKLEELKNNYLNALNKSVQNNSFIINKSEKNDETNSPKEVTKNNMIIEKNTLDENKKCDNLTNPFNNVMNDINNKKDGNQTLMNIVATNKFIYRKFKIIYRKENDNSFSNNHDNNNSCSSLFSPKNININNYYNFFKNKIKKNNTLPFDTYLNKIIFNTKKKNLIKDDGSSNLVIKRRRNKINKNKNNNDEINLNDKCFPFTSGKGIINNTSIMKNEDTTKNNNNGSGKKDEISNENNNNGNSNEKTYTDNDLYLMKFTTKKYFINEYGKKRRIIKKRKYNPDIIRKKIKSRFHKILKNVVNRNLKKAGSEKLFDFLPQCFLINISKKINTKYFELTYKDLLYNDFTLELNKTNNYRNKEIDKNKVINNRKVLNYLENNRNICEKAGFDKLKKMKYKDILSNYFISKEFEDSLNEIKKENEGKEYIQLYIFEAKNYIKFYTNDSPQEKNITENDGNEEYEDDDDDNISEDY